MKKTLIALAVLGATACVAQAQSSVTIYGQIQPSYNYMSYKQDGEKIKSTDMANIGSRIGVMGSEELGGGLKAIFKLESNFDIVNDGGFAVTGGKSSYVTKNAKSKFGNGDGGARDSYVGLAGSYGTVMFGNIDSVYKSVSASYDPFEDTIGDYNSIMSYVADNRYTQTANYYSPVFNGVQFQGNYSLNQGQSSNAWDTSAYSLAAVYNNGPLNLLAAFDHQNLTHSVDREYWKVGAAYNFGQGTTVRAIYEKMKFKLTGDSMSAAFWLIGAEHKIGATTLMANYISAGNVDGPDSGATAYNLGVKYDLSKRTNIMGVYAYLKNDINAGYSNVAGYGGDFGSKITGFSVRLQHKF